MHWHDAKLVMTTLILLNFFTDMIQYYFFHFIIAFEAIYQIVNNHFVKKRGMISFLSLPRRCTIVKHKKDLHEEYMVVFGRREASGLSVLPWLTDCFVLTPQYVDFFVLSNTNYSNLQDIY